MPEERERSVQMLLQVLRYGFDERRQPREERLTQPGAPARKFDQTDLY
jgi:hypothetical protein